MKTIAICGPSPCRKMPQYTKTMFRLSKGWVFDIFWLKWYVENSHASSTTEVNLDDYRSLVLRADMFPIQSAMPFLGLHWLEIFPWAAAQRQQQ